MNDFFDQGAGSSHHDPGADPHADLTHQHEPGYTLWASAMDQRDVQTLGAADSPVGKERLFPRKVLFGWALVTLIVYTVFRTVGTVIKETVRDSVAASKREAVPGSDNHRLIIMLPNGKRITIKNDNGGGDGSPTVTVDRTGDAVAAPKAPPAVAEPKAPEPVKAPAKK